MTIITGYSGNDSAEKYWNFETLKNPPRYRDDEVPESHYPGLRAIILDGVAEKGKRTQMFAYIGIPSGPVPAGGFPGVVLVHGGGGTALAWVAELWMSYGYAVIVPDWYGNRPLEQSYGKPTDLWKREAVKEERSHSKEDIEAHIANVSNLILAHSLLLSLPEVDPDKTVYAGVSWGSWYGAMIAAVDPRFKGFIQIYLGDRKEDDSFINGRFLHAAKAPLYYVTGTNDVAGSPLELQAGFNACGAMLGNRSMINDLCHGHCGFSFEICRRYADFILKNGVSLPVISDCICRDGKIEARVTECGKGIKKCFFNYTCDRDVSDWRERKWKAQEVDFNDGMLHSQLPGKVFQCYFSAYDEEDITTHCCGSSDVITF